MASIFEKESLEKLSSPEQLDKMIKIASPMVWLSVLGGTLITIAVIVWGFFGTLPTSVNLTGILTNNQSSIVVFAEMSGKVNLVVEKGGFVQEGEVVAVFEDLTSHNSIATTSGVVTSIYVQDGQIVPIGTELFRMEEVSNQVQNSGTIICYVPVDHARMLQTGMEVAVSAGTPNEQDYGHMNAVITEIDKYASTSAEMIQVLGDTAMVNALQNGSLIKVTVELNKDADTVSGFEWSNEMGSEIVINNGDDMFLRVITENYAPFSQLF